MKLKQTDFLNRSIKYYGCLFMSLIDIAATHMKVEPTKEQVEFIYSHVIERGFMKDSCWILNHQNIIKESLKIFGMPDSKVTYDGVYYVYNEVKDWGDTGDYCIIQWDTKNQNFSHFTRGNYDPWGGGPLECELVLSHRYYSISHVPKV